MSCNENAAASDKASSVGISNSAMPKECLKSTQIATDFSELNQKLLNQPAFVLGRISNGDVIGAIAKIHSISRESAAILSGHMIGSEFGEVLQ